MALKESLQNLYHFMNNMKNKQKNGYVLIYKPDHKHSETKKGWILEHRAVVEDYLSRKLKSGECVHHINGHKKDNKIENLMVFENNNKHMSFHTKVNQVGITNPVKRAIENRWKDLKN